ncbi:cache domain-containing sensor histidine kinase [Blautia producta]|uniref:histidine kinase n=1 Tax=Blautia producta TaxID=33035 RepID=A0A4P6M6Y0_9FIRM|nr:sensor histidine kinase [Blautia producta]QBE99955.1 Sensor histidine kinase YpdA [Blautia producta]
MLQSIRSKVLLAILAVTMVTACSITVVFYFKSAGMIEENYSTNLYGRVKQTVTSLDDSLQEIYYINVKAAGDINMAQYIKEYRKSESGEALDKIAELLRNYRTEYKDLSSLYFVFPDERIAVTSEDYPVCKRDIPEEEIVKIRQTEAEEAVPIMFGDMVHDTGKQLSCIQSVTDEDGTVLGYMLANTEERTLFYEYLEPVYDGKVSQALILDKNREIVTSKDYESVGQVYEGVDRLPEVSGIENQDAKEIRIFYQGAFSKCGLYMDIRKSEVLRDLKQMQIFLVAIFFLFLMIGGILATSITRAMYKPIKNMTDTVEKVSKGDLSLRVDVTTEDEIGTLCREFNNMLDNLEDLIARVIEEERLKKDAELEALQYQITPHFMYNTLNSIKYAALIKGEKELGGLIGDFVELLQASINKKGTFISVADELHILKNYIHLQEFRYQGGFDVEYDISQEAYGCYIPRLILQPLVENSILHGIDMKGGNGRLVIRGRVDGTRLTLSVIDNGRGMTREQIQALLSSKAKKTNGLSAIGVPNVRERLELYYEEEGGIIYESSESGTTASIFLPVNREVNL